MKIHNVLKNLVVMALLGIVSAPALAQSVLPAVTTGNATNITSNSATLFGTINANNTSANSWFEYGTTASFGTQTGSQPVTGNTAQSVQITLNNLQPNTIYYYRLMGQSPSGNVPGATANFTTLNQGQTGSCSATPTATTNQSPSISGNTITITGTINPNGTQTSGFVEYGTTVYMGERTNLQTVGNANASTGFTATLYNLQSNTVYFYRVVAQNTCGENRYGQTYSFNTQGTTYNNYQSYYQGTYGTNYNYNNTYPYNNYNYQAYPYYNTNTYNTNPYSYIPTYTYTPPTTYTNTNYSGTGSPLVTTQAATSISGNGATLNSAVTPNGSQTTAWLEYGTNASLGLSSSHQSIGSTGSAIPRFTRIIGALAPGTTYYFRGAAENSYGRNYGQVLSFKTLGSGDTITSIPIQTTVEGTGGNNTNNNGVASSDNLIVTSDLTNPNPAPGEETTQNTIYRNTGTAPIENVRITITIPKETEYISAVPTPSSRTDQVLVFELGSMQPGSAGSIVVRLKVKTDANPALSLSLRTDAEYTDSQNLRHSKNTNIAFVTKGGSVAGVSQGTGLTATISNTVDKVPTYGWYIFAGLIALIIIGYVVVKMIFAEGH